MTDEIETSVSRRLASVRNILIVLSGKGEGSMKCIAHIQAVWANPHHPYNSPYLSSPSPLRTALGFSTSTSLGLLCPAWSVSISQAHQSINHLRAGYRCMSTKDGGWA